MTTAKHDFRASSMKRLIHRADVVMENATEVLKELRTALAKHEALMQPGQKRVFSEPHLRNTRKPMQLAPWHAVAMRTSKTGLGKLQNRLKHNEQLLHTAHIKIEDLMAESQSSQDRIAESRLARRRPTGV